MIVLIAIWLIVVAIIGIAFYVISLQTQAVNQDGIKKGILVSLQTDEIFRTQYGKAQEVVLDFEKNEARNPTEREKGMIACDVIVESENRYSLWVRYDSIANSYEICYDTIQSQNG